MERVARLEARRLPDAAMNAVPVLLAGERLAEATAVAVVGRARLDAEDERGLALERAGQIDVDRRPPVAVRGDRRLVDRTTDSWKTPSITRAMRLPAQPGGSSIARR